MKQLFSCLLLTILMSIATLDITYSQMIDGSYPQLYEQGSVWQISFIRIKANATEEYIKGIKQTWDASAKEQVKAGIMKSYKIFIGNASNEQDFNMIMMEEYPNMAALDPTPEKVAAGKTIDKKVQENMHGEFEKTVINYDNIRKWLGIKIMREITIK